MLLSLMVPILCFHNPRLIGRDANPILSLSSILISSVEILQQTILEVYVLFLQPMEVNVANTTERLPLSGGLVGYYLRQFIRSVGPLTPSVNWSSIEELIEENVAPLSILEIWYQWVRSNIDFIQSSCKGAFSRITSPADVSKLQRLVSQSCFAMNVVQEIYQRNEISFQHGLSDDSALTSVWSTSCSCLLENILTTRWNQYHLQFHSRSLHPLSGGAEGGKFVWIYIFRQPFLSLVERLMKISCRDIFHTVKQNMLGVLTDLSSITRRSLDSTQKVKLMIDSFTFDIKYQTFEKKKKTTQCDSNITQQGSCMDDDINIFATSTEIFLHAEKIRLYLENQMINLMNELLFTVIENSYSF